MPRNIRHYVRKRGKTYTAIVSYYDDTGDRHSPSRGGFRTNQEAYDAGARMAADIAGNLNILGADVTFGEYAALWLDSFQFEEIGTENSYRWAVGVAITHIGSIPVSKLTTRGLQSFINTLVEHGYVPTSVRATIALTRRILDFAVEERLLQRNPARSPWIRTPKVHQDETVKFLSNEELERLFRELEPYADSRYYRLGKILLASQVRIGEATGLTWDRVDFDEGVIHVTHQLHSRRGLKRLKTDASRRTISIDPDTLALLAEHRELQRVELAAAPRRDIRPFVFTTRLGTPITSEWSWKVFRKFGIQVGIPQMRPHLFRHTGASMLLRAGVPIPIVSQRLGHANPAITMRIYAHALPSDDEIAAGAMADILQKLGS